MGINAADVRTHLEERFKIARVQRREAGSVARPASAFHVV